MGWLSDIGGIFSTAAKAVATGGISLIAPKLIPKPINTALNALTRAQFPTSFQSLAQTGLAVATKNPSFLLPSQGAQPMALNIPGLLGTVGQAFGGSSNPYLQGFGNVAGIAGQFAENIKYRPPQGLGAPGGGAVAPRPQGPLLRIPRIGKRFFDKFPNLATAMQQLRDRGQAIKRSQLYSLLRRFGPELLITGGLLTAAAVSELMVAGPGRRRMNAGNAHALRRSLRRVEAFHKLCVRADSIRRPRSRKSCKSSSSTQFVRQG